MNNLKNLTEQSNLNWSLRDFNVKRLSGYEISHKSKLTENKAYWHLLNIIERNQERFNKSIAIPNQRALILTEKDER